MFPDELLETVSPTHRNGGMLLLLWLQHELHHMDGFTQSGRRQQAQVWKQATGRRENKLTSASVDLTHTMG